jgi:ferredoxin
VNAISAQEDVPDAQVWFDINMRLSQNWPRITKKKPALPDAEEWKDKPNKIDLLEE